MKIKSLLLGSVAAAGLTTSAFAADLGVVLTSLDTCDSLGISGLTISSDSNCLKISGGVSYEFKWGDYDGSNTWVTNAMTGGTITTPDNGGAVGSELDWNSTVEAWLKFEGSADSSFGTAMAVIELEYTDAYAIVNEVPASSTANMLGVGDAYVAVGDTTVLMAGKKGSIANMDDDEPFGYLGLFNSEIVGDGVGMNAAFLGTGGHVIQVTSDLGNGVSVAAGLENLDGTSSTATAADDGTAVGVLAYSGDGISAHVTVLAGGVLDGTVENWGIHSGFTGTFDMFSIRGAVAADNTGYWNALGSASATFDMFTLAVSGEAAASTVGFLAGVGGSVSVAATEGVTINLGGRWIDTDTGVAATETMEGRAQLVAALTETLTATGTVGIISTNTGVPVTPTTIYFEGELAWAPGGGFESAIGAGGNDDGAYWVNFSASKDFE